MHEFAYLEEITEKILQDSNLFNAPVAIDHLIQKMGIKIDEQELNLGVSGMAVVHGNSRIISVNRNQHERRKRFTMGHELAHILLDNGSPLSIDQKIFYRDGASDWKEQRANFFSASILMPKKLIDLYLEENNPARAFGDDEIEQIASAFNVSTQAMCIRLSALGLL